MPSDLSRDTAAQSFFPRAFIETMREGFLHLDATMREFDNYAERARVEIEIADGKTNTDNQRGISILYDNIVTVARETLLFMALVRKNVAFMPTIARHIHDDVHRATLGRIWTRGYTHGTTREIETFAKDFFDVIEPLGQLMDARTWDYRYRTPFRGDHYMIEMTPGRPLTRLDFNDWIEFNFFRHYKMPLGQFERSRSIEKAIKTQTASPVFLKRTAERVWKRRLHVYFPGLTLDPERNDGPELERLSKYLGPHVPFTPDTTARVVRAPEDEFPVLFGSLAFRP